jgi:hypothetical protein
MRRGETRPLNLVDAEEDSWPVAKQIDGIDALGIISGKKSSSGRVLYLGKATATIRRWKLGGEELYDLDSDPDAP